MKVKLLKKIRRRYSIHKVNHITPRCKKSDLGKFEVINDSGDRFDFTSGIYDTKDDALYQILRYARKNYSSYSVNKRTKKKVWWNE